MAGALWQKSKAKIFWLHRSCHCQKLSRLGKIAQIYLPCLLLIARVLKSKQYCNLAADIFLLLGVPSPLPRAHHNVVFATVASQFPNLKSARQKTPIHIFSMTLLLFCENQFERLEFKDLDVANMKTTGKTTMFDFTTFATSISKPSIHKSRNLMPVIVFPGSVVTCHKHFCNQTPLLAIKH